MTEVNPTDVGDPLPERRLGPPHRADKSGDGRVADRVNSPLQQVVERAGEDRHDREVPICSEEVLQENNLELNRMLAAMSQFVLEQRRANALGQEVDKILIRPDQAQRSLEVLASERKPLSARGMGDAEDDEDVGVRALDQLLV